MTRLNLRTRLTMPKCWLVPYRASHVRTYHAWMTDPELLRLTASEPLTLDEEYANQRSWRDDEGKMTFIVCEVAPGTQATQPGAVATATRTPVGDVNVFVLAEDSSGGEEDGSAPPRRTGEIEVMIAEPRARGKGIAYQALCGMLLYSKRVLALDSFVAKIGFENTASLALFNKLGFEHDSSSDAFREHTLRSTEQTFKLARAEVGGDQPREEEDLDPDVERARLAGNAAFARGDMVAAVGAYDAGLDLDERNAVLYANRSQARLRSMDPYGALMDAAAAVALDPKYVKAHHRLAAAWAFLGETKRAKAVYEDAATAFPSERKSLAGLASKLTGTTTDPSIQLTPNFIASREMMPAFLPVLVDAAVSSPNSRAVRFGAITAMWRRLESTEKCEIFELFCRVMDMDADKYDVTPNVFDRPDQANIVMPGGLPETQLPASLRAFIKSVPAPTNGRSGRIAAMELLFGTLPWPDRMRVGEVLNTIIAPAMVEANHNADDAAAADAGGSSSSSLP